MTEIHLFRCSACDDKKCEFRSTSSDGLPLCPRYQNKTPEWKYEGSWFAKSEWLGQ